MIYVEQQFLRDRAKKLGIVSREMSTRMNVPAGTIRCWLSGFSEMPIQHQATLRRMIAERDSLRQDSTPQPDRTPA